MKPVRSLAPLLRGEGWGEGLSLPKLVANLIENNSLLDSADVQAACLATHPDR
jgi:hypothetical protein